MWRTLTRSLHVLPPETAHAAALAALRLVPTIHNAETIGTAVEVMGLRFPNRIGLAAGFDKNGNHINQFAKLGFGFIEIGTITPKPQSGSPAPRLFRLPAVGGLINRMGFNNLGVDYAARKLAKQGGDFSGILGCNIGCNRDTPQPQAVKDYLHCLRKLYGLANYYVINVSSPNTPGLRNMQRPILLHSLLTSLVELREELITNHKERTPLLVKVDPDQNEEQIEAMAEVIASAGMDGVVAANTTVHRSQEIASQPYGGQPGGLSGRPLRAAADAAIAMWRKHLRPDLALIGVGGVFSREDAQAKFAAGANLVQLYTGLIYQGPQLVAECAASSPTSLTSAAT